MFSCSSGSALVNTSSMSCPVGGGTAPLISQKQCPVSLRHFLSLYGRIVARRKAERVESEEG